MTMEKPDRSEGTQDLSAKGGFSRVPSMFSSLEVKVFYPTRWR
jgi:hypothetical protein